MKTKMCSRLRCLALEDRVTPTVAGGTSPEQIPTDQFLASIGSPSVWVHQRTQSESEGLYLLASQFADGVAISRVHYDGSIDKTFGTNGITTIETGSVPTATSSRVASIDVSREGRVVMNVEFTLPIEPYYHFVTTVLSENGSFDSSFGIGGKSELFTGMYPSSSIIDSQGRIVISGPVGFSSSVSVVTRRTTDGKFDNSFGNSGWTNPFDAMGVILGEQPTTGRIVATGNKQQSDFAVTAFLPTGQLDPSFGQAGTTTISINQPNSSGSDLPTDFFFRSDGAITIVGTSNRVYISKVMKVGVGFFDINTKRIDDIAVVHLTSNGQPDQAFSDDGVELYPIHVLNQPGEVNYAYPVSASLGSAHSIIVKSYVSPDGGNNKQYQLTRIQSFGQIDLSYGTQGTKIYDLTSPPESTSAHLPNHPRHCRSAASSLAAVWS